MVIILRKRCQLIMINKLKFSKYCISVGAPETPTPRGIFRVVERWQYPRYKCEDGTIYPGSKDVWTGLGPLLFIFVDLRGQKIRQSLHGFVENWPHFPDYVKSNGLNFRQESYGCIRMRNQDILDADAHIRIGDWVLIW